MAFLAIVLGMLLEEDHGPLGEDQGPFSAAWAPLV